ncbi:MAG: ABC transporter ATP-binding protein [Planctomycetota bacterium]
MSAAPVTLRGVVRRLGRRTVLDGVHLEAPAGQVLVLLGESGAGKSTLLRLVAGLDTPDAGTIEIGGRVVADPKSRVAPHARGVGMVFQTLELWPHMTVAENVAFGLPGRPHGARAATHPRVLAVAEAVGLPRDLLARRSPTLSGGERQRVAIARALATEPGVLLYDEPLAHLDPSRRGEIRGLVRRVAATRTTTVVYVTHDPAEALEVGDVLVVLAHGRVVDEGAPADVYACPRSLTSARALGAVSPLAARRRDPDTVECVLGAVGARGGPGLGSGWLLLRPEQVGARAGGDAVVTEDFAVPGAHAFRARLRDGATVEGRTTSALAPGTAVTVAVTGTGVLVPAEEVA